MLATRGFNPPGVVFPVSAVILQRIDEYRAVLEDYSQRLLPVIRWEEAEFRRRYDRFTAGVQTIVDMPDRTRDLLFKLVHRNGGRLSQRARSKEFSKLTDAEAERIKRL